MIWTGRCQCGAVRFEATSDPIRVVHCHCGQCRKATGAVFYTHVHFKVTDFTWTGRVPTRYRTSPDAERGFCPVCGSTTSMHERVLPDRVQVALGLLDTPERVHPQDHVWTKRQMPWLVIDDDLPRFETISTAVPSKAIEDPQ